MDAARNYKRLALDCLKIAQRAHDPAIREKMTRLAQLWAGLVHQAKNRQSSPVQDDTLVGSEFLFFHAQHASIPSRRRADIPAVQDDMIDSINRKGHVSLHSKPHSFDNIEPTALR